MTDKFIEYIRDIRRYSPRTCEIYRDVLSEYVAFAGGVLMPEYQQIRNYEVHLLDDKKENARTVNLHLSVLSGYCKFLMKKGQLKSNPVRAVTRPKQEKRLPPAKCSHNCRMIQRSPETPSQDIRTPCSFRL